MRVAELDDVTYDLEVDGELVRRTCHRRVWERRGWATVAIIFEERDPAGTGWRPPRLAVIRLQRSRGAWKKHAAITLAGADAAALGAWLTAHDLGAGDPDELDPGDPEAGPD